MRELKSLDPRIEVSGCWMAAFVECPNGSRLAPIMRDHDIMSIQKQSWYPANVWMEILRDTLAARGGALHLAAVGMKLPDTALTPNNITSAKTAILMLDTMYQMNFRGGNVGWFDVQLLVDGHILVNDNTPWPMDITYGLLQGLTRRYGTTEEKFEVLHDYVTSRMYHEEDAKVYQISWRPVKTPTL
jgi:hypothetical protein